MTDSLLCPVCRATETTLLMSVDRRNYWRCQHCHATFLDPQQLPKRGAEFAEYLLHQNKIGDPGYRQWLARLATPLLERLPANQSGLDYGCGPGPALAAMLSEAGHQMAIYDPLFFNDDKVLEAQYDFMTCSEVVEHFHDPFTEFGRIDQRLKPGGLLAIMTQFQTDDAAFAGWHYRRDPTHVIFYRETTFQLIAQTHGWHCEVPQANIVFMYKS